MLQNIYMSKRGQKEPKLLLQSSCAGRCAALQTTRNSPHAAGHLTNLRVARFDLFEV